MKKLFMLGVFLFSTMAFTIDVYAMHIGDLSDVSRYITGVTVEDRRISLNQDLNLGNETITIIGGGPYTIDLNGYTISGNNDSVIEHYGDTSLTIDDSSVSKTGKIICTKENRTNSERVAIRSIDAKTTINGGTFEGADYGAYFENNVTINGGTFGNNDSLIGAVITKSATINNGVFKGKVGFSYKDSIASNTLTINNGTFGNENSTNGISLESGKVIINNATLNTRTDKGIGLAVAIYTMDNIDLTIENINSTGGLAGLVIDSETESNDNIININGGTFSGKMYGSAIGENMISHTEISGGRFMSTNSDESENFGGVVIMKEQITTGSQNSSFESQYTLKTLLKSGYNYSNRTFNEKTRVDTLEDMVATITFSGTAKDVFVAQERTIDIKDGIHNGTVTAQEMAVVGEEVTLTVTPLNGYKLNSISALDKFDEMPVTITNNKFVMPDYNVFIGAVFEKIDYSYFKESEEQTYKINKDDKLEFKLKPDYSLFENGGKVYVDDELVDQKYITSKSGSTIITLSKEYLDKLSIGNHTLKVTFNTDKSVETIFTISREEPNPKTGDGIMNFIFIGSISLIGLLGTSLYLKKKRYN